MQVKTQHEEFNGWLTELQWNKQGKTIIKDDESLQRLLWINGYCKVKAVFISPKNVRDMTPEELEKFKESESIKKQEQKDRAKKRQADREAEHRYWQKKRAEWHTDWQWYQLDRKPKAGAEWVVGADLNYKDEPCPFGRDYTYYHINDTVEFESEQDKEAYYRELYKSTYGRYPEDNNDRGGE